MEHPIKHTGMVNKLSTFVENLWKINETQYKIKETHWKQKTNRKTMTIMGNIKIIDDP